MDPMLQRCDCDHLCLRLFFLQLGAMGRCNSKPAQGVIEPLQKHLEQSMAEDHFGHFVSQQAGLFVC